MHTRIIWTLFLAAFILDFFRSRSTTSQSEEILNYNKEQEEQKNINLNDIPEKPKKEMKAKINEEELEVIYEDNINRNKKKNKKKSQNIDLRIEFCQSWSHRGYFNQVKEHLESNYSNISVIPSDYPLSTTRKILYYIVTFFQFGLIIVVFCGKYIKEQLNGIIPGNYFDWIEENKMVVGMAAFFIGNILNNNITNSGAFEIYCNEKLIWSAINNEKRVPNLESIINMIQRYGGRLIKY